MVHPLNIIYFLVHHVWCHRVQIPLKSKAQNATWRALKKKKLKLKLKFGNTKLGLPSLNEAKSKEGHPLFHPFFLKSQKSIFKIVILCVSVLSPTTTNQKVLQFLSPKVDLHKILNFRYTIHFVVVAMMFCSPPTWTNGCIVKLSKIFNPSTEQVPDSRVFLH